MFFDCKELRVIHLHLFLLCLFLLLYSLVKPLNCLLQLTDFGVLLSFFEFGSLLKLFKFLLKSRLVKRTIRILILFDALLQVVNFFLQNLDV